MTTIKSLQAESADRNNWIAEVDREAIEKAATGVRLRPPLRVVETDVRPAPPPRKAA